MVTGVTPLPRGVTLRPREEGDAAFLERLYVEARWDELTVAGWPEPMKTAFLRSQFVLQSRHYATHYGDASFSIILREGAPIGRLDLHRGPKEIRVVDISLLAEARGAGIGTGLLRHLGADAAAGGRIVSLHVDQFNPALKLYRRLGFLEKKVAGPSLLMEWSP
jgi:ribosomal protein S18 acetylase RimI-like enzyme